MEECYVYNTFEKRKYDFTSALHIRRLVHQKDCSQKKLLNTQQLQGDIIIFKTILQTKENEVLVCQFENRNSYGMFAMRLCEVSRITKFIIDRGATESVMVTGTHYRRSPLVKGGLEIPCKVSVSMRETCLNLLLLER